MDNNLYALLISKLKNVGGGTSPTSGSGVTVAQAERMIEDAISKIPKYEYIHSQSDWNESNESADSFIKNKPVIPTVPEIPEVKVKSVSVDGTSINPDDSGNINIDISSKYVAKVNGKGLSSNDYTSEDKAEVAKIKNKFDSVNILSAFQSEASNTKVPSEKLLKSSLESFINPISYQDKIRANVCTGDYLSNASFLYDTNIIRVNNLCILSLNAVWKNINQDKLVHIELFRLPDEIVPSDSVISNTVTNSGKDCYLVIGSAKDEGMSKLVGVNLPRAVTTSPSYDGLRFTVAWLVDAYKV